MKKSSATATWLREWDLDGPGANPPYIGRIPMTLEYVYRYALDMAYIAPPGITKRSGHLNCGSTILLHTMAAATRESREMRITQIHPDTQWTQMWKNLHTAWISEEIKSMWYITVHEIVPTNDRLHAIRLVESDRCRHCERRDTLVHGLTECNEGTAIWLWTRERIAQMLRKDPRRIPAEWCLRPHFQFWPPQRYKAILWLLAHLVLYRMQQQRHLSLLDYIDFLRRARWKSYRAASRMQQVGNYLSIL